MKKVEYRFNPCNICKKNKSRALICVSCYNRKLDVLSNRSVGAIMALRGEIDDLQTEIAELKGRLENETNRAAD